MYACKYVCECVRMPMFSLFVQEREREREREREKEREGGRERGEGEEDKSRIPGTPPPPFLSSDIWHQRACIQCCFRHDFLFISTDGVTVYRLIVLQMPRSAEWRLLRRNCRVSY